VIRRIHHRRGLTFLLGSGHIGILVYAIMTTSNVLTIGAVYRWVVVKVHHPYRDLLTGSCRSPQAMPEFINIGPAFAYILPSALVIVSSLSSATFALLIMVAPLSSHVECACDPLCKPPCRIRHSVLFRVLMLRRKASPTETELRFEHSHMINEALEMIDVTPKNFMSSIPTDAQALP
jgi:hypothetical protein